MSLGVYQPWTIAGQQQKSFSWAPNLEVPNESADSKSPLRHPRLAHLPVSAAVAAALLVADEVVP